MKERLISVLALTVLLTVPCFVGYAAVMGGALPGHDPEGTAGNVPTGSALDRAPLKLAQQQPPYASPTLAEGAGPGQWVDVPGQWVGGTWVPPHRAWVPANSSPPAAGGQYGPQPPPQAPPGYGQEGPGGGYPPPSPYAFPAAPEVVPVPGSYVYFVPNIGVDILFYHGYWYRPYRGYWYRALSYNGPWVYLPSRSVPHVLITLPPGYRKLPPGYHPIPHAELQRNWERWERERHWEHHH